MRNFRRSGGATSEEFLEQGDKDVSERRGNEGAVDSHLGDTGSQVGAILAAVASDHGGEDFLEGRKRTGSEHLGPPERLLSVFHACRCAQLPLNRMLKARLEFRRQGREATMDFPGVD